MRALHAKCFETSKEGVSVEEAIELIAQILYTRREVGLIAGWEAKTEQPALYRVDGIGGVIKGEILASGSGFRGMYDSLVLREPHYWIQTWMAVMTTGIILLGVGGLSNKPSSWAEEWYCVTRDRLFSPELRNVKVKDLLVPK
ncbi:OLC1v1038289C1 [Oldenlandia corymbosa var. corymbosa]|uniref:OLC1v1038289C1 n=1 Tax=Oldenlandia corymbosa var. corymbosa TaxID=529605 RepID=A0AAV1CZK3_OLDCO|nr:OLC1v1038289C1 [Oldenlandia corymbosa var. corymbosa]